ncbi:hypothetical protein ONZ51_g374 [Trametes cubensis]|uniref:Uncharacterized protein n=1 Tax=Trametes cubensis TaxID=1111947 RepID=A0AAD7XGX2_9APHY|nr:hypothetical protein ONZ51_g374 [Trametes cubensis]
MCDTDPQGPPGNPPGAPPGQGKGKIRGPEVFNGDWDKTRSFLNQLFLLLTARPHDFVNDYTNVATALSFMEGDNINYWQDITIQRAEEEIRPGVYQGFDSWPVFKRNFLLTFAPVDEVDDSMVNLTTMQLKDYSSVNEFNARVDDSLNINKLSVKARQELQDKGAQQVTDKDLEDESEEISDKEDDEDEEDNISINALRATDFETGF